MKLRFSMGASRLAARAVLVVAASFAMAAWSSPSAAQSTVQESATFVGAVVDDPPPGLSNEAVTDAGASPDKSRYHLFHRTPRPLMREMATDRPDTTESPISVDAGHFQLETEMVNVERDNGATSQTFGALNLKVGLASWTDFQVVFDLLHRAGNQSDLGDLTFRNKINLWGNDGGSTALALMPFVTLPVSRLGPGYTEGGLIIPLGIEGPAGWEFATMVELDLVRRDRTYGMDVMSTATAGHAIWEPLGGFVEVAAVTPLADEPVVLSANSGLVLGLTDDLMLDGGVRWGLTDSAPDVAAFVGGSGRY